MYFEDFEQGQSFDSVGRTVTEADVALFAGLSGDYNQLHTDETFAERSQFGGRIAHGLLVLSMTTGLTQRLGLFEGTALALLELNWRFTGVVAIGDTIRFRMTITEKRETSKPDRGVLKRQYSVLNQRDETVQEGVITILIRRRNSEK